MKNLLFLLVLISFGFSAKAQITSQGRTPVHTVQSTAPSLELPQVVEVPGAPTPGPAISSQTAPDLNGNPQTAPTGGGSGPIHTTQSSQATLPPNSNLNPTDPSGDLKDEE